jgi:hypothetical protein
VTAKKEKESLKLSQHRLGKVGGVVGNTLQVADYVQENDSARWKADFFINTDNM